MPKIGADVDAASLRVADLRAVLREHAVPVPSGARKATLIDAFEMHVRPALLDATKREVGASTAGSGVKEERASGEAEAKAMEADAVPKTDTPVAQGEHDVLRAPAATGTPHAPHMSTAMQETPKAATPRPLGFGTPGMRAVPTSGRHSIDALDIRFSDGDLIQQPKRQRPRDSEHDAEPQKRFKERDESHTERALDEVPLGSAGTAQDEPTEAKHLPVAAPPAVTALADDTAVLTEQATRTDRGYTDALDLAPLQPRKRVARRIFESPRPTSSRPAWRVFETADRACGAPSPHTPYSRPAATPPLTPQPDAQPWLARTPRTTRTPAHVRHLAESAGTPAPAAPSAAPASIAQQLRAHWRGTLARVLCWLLLGAWLLYCRQTRVLGYCDTGSAPQPMPMALRSALVHVATPQCTPCPDQGVCFGGRLRACINSDYVIDQPLQARLPVVAQLLPLSWRASRCVPDTFKLELASELADAVEDHLAEWHGRVRCGLDAPVAGAPVHRLARFALPSAHVKAALQTQVSEMDDATYEMIWDMAMTGLAEHASSDVLDISGGRSAWLVAPRASMPLPCRLRLFVLDLAWRHKVHVALVLAAVIAAHVAVRRTRRARVQRARVARLVRAVYARLQAQALKHAQALGVPRGLPVTLLRDAVLEAEPNARVRRQQWAAVARVVEQNANVRSRQVQWEGVWQRVWEWMGMVERSEWEGATAGQGAPSVAAAAPAADGCRTEPMRSAPPAMPRTQRREAPQRTWMAWAVSGMARAATGLASAALGSPVQGRDAPVRRAEEPDRRRADAPTPTRPDTPRAPVRPDVRRPPHTPRTPRPATPRLRERPPWRF